MILILGIAAIAAVVLLKRQTPVYYPPVTGNAQRDSKVSEILAWAAAAGATATAIANLINSLSSSSDSQINSTYQSVQSNGVPNVWLA